MTTMQMTIQLMTELKQHPFKYLQIGKLVRISGMSLCILAFGFVASIAIAQELESRSSTVRIPNDDQHSKEKLDRKNPAAEIARTTDEVVRGLPRPSNARPEVQWRNLIDEYLFSAMKKDGIPHASIADDYTFLRRVSLDLTGRLPTPEQIQKFVHSNDEHKRDQVIEDLLASDAWVDKWAYWYGDLFRNCANRIGNAATQNLDRWIRDSLHEDKPYNQFVTELLTVSAPNSVWLPDSAASGYLARWHIPADTMYSDRYEDTCDEIVVQSARFFLGLNFQCISCHGGSGFLDKVDLGLSRLRREDLWAMAAFFGNTRIRIVPYQDRFTISEDGTGYDTRAASSVRLQRDGDPIVPTFLLTGQQAVSEEPLRAQFAKMLTEHPQFARATVNLFWKEFFAIGMVDPVDGFDLARQDPDRPPPAPWTIQPTNPALLKAFGDHFAQSGFRLKDLMRTIVQSTAYQMSSHMSEEWRASYTPYFARHFVKQLSAEQLHDSIVEATSVYPDYPRKHLMYGTPQPPIRYWTQAATPENVNNSEAKQVLRTFGQSNREWANPVASGSILQALMMMNSSFVTKRISIHGGGQAQKMFESDLDPPSIVENMYLKTLCRKPTQDELDLAQAWIEQDRKTGIEDLQWALLNKLDFLFVY